MNTKWELVEIGDVCQLVNGGTPKTDNGSYWGGPHQWITPAEMGGLDNPYVRKTRRSLTDRGLANSSATLVPPLSVILSSRAPIGYLIINEVEMATNQGCKCLVPSDALYYKFLFYHLVSIRDHLESLGTGATFKELSASKLRTVKIPLPPLSEQKRIAAKLDEAVSAIKFVRRNTEKKLEQLDHLSISVISSTLSGD